MKSTLTKRLFRVFNTESQARHNLHRALNEAERKAAQKRLRRAGRVKRRLLKEGK